MSRHGSDLLGGTGGAAGPSAVFDCLFKDRFARKVEQLGFPTPEWGAPITVEDAVVVAESVGYPVVLKPRSHIGVGISRGVIAHDESELRAAFTPYELDRHQSSALAHDPDIAWPLVQKIVGGNDSEVISVTGCLGRDGDVLALGFSRKLTQWQGALGIGTMFEVVDQPGFADRAVELVREVLGSGIFEFEVIVDPTTDEYWALELNPRGFSQMGLDVEHGRDLPRLWFGSATGQTLNTRRPRGRKYWRFGLPFYAGLLVAVVLGPGRLSAVRRLGDELRRRSVGSMHTWNDPVPGFVFAAGILRHPRALVKSLPALAFDVWSLGERRSKQPRSRVEGLVVGPISRSIRSRLLKCLIDAGVPAALER